MAEVLENLAPMVEPDAVVRERDRGDVLFQCLAWVAAHHGDERSVAAWRQGLPQDREGSDVQTLIRAAEGAGYRATLVERSLSELPDYVLPVIVLLRDAQAAVLIRRLDDGLVEVAMPESADGLLPVRLPLDELLASCTGFHVLVKPIARADERAGPVLMQANGHWFWSALWRYRSYYTNTALAAAMINVLTLAGTFFTMNVYDRVVPTRAYPTLWTLAIGTLLAMTFEFATRQMRSHMVDVAGKKWIWCWAHCCSAKPWISAWRPVRLPRVPLPIACASLNRCANLQPPQPSRPLPICLSPCCFWR